MDNYTIISPCEHKILKALTRILEQPAPSRSIRKALATKLKVSQETIKTHLENLTAKFAIDKEIRGEQRYRKIVLLHEQNKPKRKMPYPPMNPPIAPPNYPPMMRETR